MKKRTFVLFLSALALASCNGASQTSTSQEVASSGERPESSTPAPSSQEAITVTDMTGRQVNILPGSYERIVCVGGGALRLYSYIGDLDLLSGVEDIDNPTARASGSGRYFEGVPRPYYDAFKDSFDGLPSCGVGGPMNQAPELEKLIACSPDLILSEYNSEAALSMENATGATVFNLSYGSKTVFDDNAKQSLEKLGIILGKEERATELNNYIASAQKDLANRIPTSTEKPDAYIGGVGNWGAKNYLATHFSYPMFEAAGVSNILSDSGISGSGQADITEEAFITLSPEMDVMILDASGLSQTLTSYQSDPSIFSTVKAVKEGNAFIQLPYNVYYTNLEIALINAYFAGWAAYPEEYGDITISEKADEIFEMFLGTKLYETECALPSAYGGYQKINDLNAWMAERV